MVLYIREKVPIYLRNMNQNCDTNTFFVLNQNTNTYSISLKMNSNTYAIVFGANYLQLVFWTLNFAKKYWISMKILSRKILDFYENT